MFQKLTWGSTRIRILVVVKTGKMEVMIMKKAFLFVCAALALYSCDKTVVSSETTPGKNPEMVFDTDVTVTRQSAFSKATVKNEWAEGDVVFLFLDNWASPKYIELKNTAGKWVARGKNTGEGDVEVLLEGGTMTAVYIPYGSGLTISDDGGAYRFSEDYRGVFYYQENVPYEYSISVEAEVFSATIRLGAIQGESSDKLIHFDVSGYDAGREYAMYQDYVKPVSISSIPSSRTVGCTLGTMGKAIKGYVDPQNSILSFSGILDASAVGTDKPYDFSIIDEAANTLYTRDAASRTVSESVYIGLGDINDAGKWKANEYVDLGCTVDGKRVMWATRNLGADNSSDFGWYYAWGETSGTSLVVSYDAEQQKDIYTSPYRTFDKTYYDDYVGLPACEPGGNLPSDKDAAHRYWRGLWHIPTKAEFESTIANTTPDGRREVYTASNGNSIFLPLAGGVYGSTPKQQGTSGTYWTSTFERNGALGPGAYSFYVQYRDTPQAPSVSDIIAYNGLPIRPVFCVE